MFEFLSRRSSRPCGAPGWRAYVVGDIHGRLDLLEELLTRISQDVEQRPPRKTMLAFLGDLIDRGPNSAQVVERLRTLDTRANRKVFILGNHEEVLLRILRGDRALLADWLKFGGVQCIASYGIDPDSFRALSPDDALIELRRRVPKSHVEFLESFVDTCKFGDFLLVHAGIRPGVGIDEQPQSDLRWIREPFLSNDADYGFVVVHGHTMAPTVEVHRNRIGIDTGAYRTGILSALAIEDSQAWLVDTREAAAMPADQPV